MEVQRGRTDGSQEGTDGSPEGTDGSPEGTDVPHRLSVTNWIRLTCLCSVTSGRGNVLCCVVLCCLVWLPLENLNTTQLHLAAVTHRCAPGVTL